MTLDDFPTADQPAASLESRLTFRGPFFSADDAAFWVHEDIGDKRDRSYIGSILEKDGRFFASTPLDSSNHEVRGVVAMGPDGKLVLPPGYGCYAFYHSAAAYEPEAMSPERRVIIRSLFSLNDMASIFEHSHLVPAHYLSGPDGSLLKFVDAAPEAARRLFTGLSPSQRRELDIFNEYVPLLAEAGELWVIVANPAWGGTRGRVSKSWTLGTQLHAGSLQPLFARVTSTPDFGSLLPVSRQAPAKPVFGYQLKAVGREEYMVPVQAWERSVLTPPARLFPMRSDGGVKLPANFRINAVYCRDPSNAAWHPAHFFSPTLLAAVAEQLRAAPELYHRDNRLSLVLRASDGALLSYRFSATDAEGQFLGAGGVTVDTQLKDGTLTPRAFIERMAAIGELEVVEVGSVWRHIGRALTDEPPFAQLQRSMSPAFITADDAARYLHERIHTRDEDQLGLILQRDDGLFVSTEPLRESVLSAQLGLRYDGAISVELDLPTGYQLVGFFAAHVVSIELIKREIRLRTGVKEPLPLDDEATLYSGVPDQTYTVSITAANQKIPMLYYSSPFESLVKYVRSGSELERNFSGFLQEAMRVNKIMPQADGFDGTCVAIVRKLARLGEFHVLVSSAAWGGSRGKIPGDWAPFQAFSAAAPVPPHYSRVFQDPGTAAVYGHDQPPISAGLQQVAFILKAVHGETSVVTRPVPLKPGLSVVSPLNAFSEDETHQPVLPEGYALHGICYAPLPAQGLKIDQAWLFESFVSPAELALAIAESRKPGNTLRTLYWQTREGARLTYRFSGSALEGQLYGVAPTGVVTDNGLLASVLDGTLTSQQFVLRVAAAGALVVQRAGTLWDVEGVVDTLWTPFARYPALTLSPHFLSADDAARFAHEQVGSQRDIEYGGLILQTADQRFVATLPRRCRAVGRFAMDAVFPADHGGRLILPTAYVLHGQYASCQAASLLDPARMSRYGWSREEAYIDWQLFTDEDLRTLIGNRHRVSVAYLSCAEDALIAYDLSGSDAELALLKKLEPSAQGSPMEQRRARGEVRPADVVRELAATALRVVLGSRLWGSAGVVPEHWQAYPAVQAHKAPEQVACGAVFATADEAALHAHARIARGYSSTQTGFAFVLKHAQKDEYVVTETAPVDRDSLLFNQASLFTVSDDGASVYPSGFTLYGLLYARRWMPEQLPRDQQWLARHFLSSADLYTAFFEAKRWRPAGSLTTLPVFISTLDNALIKFQTPISTRLFEAEKQLSGHFEDVHTLLSSGQLTAQGFVTKVITLSWLTVIVGNECWDETGKLTVDWLPYADFNRRAMSPAFFTQADAVRYAQARLGVRQDQVYGGLVLRRVDGLFVATEPVPVPTENFDPQSILPSEDVRQDRLAPGMTLVARYRSRRDTLPAFLLDDEELAVYRGMFATDVLATALTCNHLWSHEYLLGLDGAVIGFSCSGPDSDLLTPQQKQQVMLERQQLQQALAPVSQTPHDPLGNLAEQHMREGQKTPTEFVNQVIKAAWMHVVQGSELWGTAQQLPRGWRTAHSYLLPEKSPYASADRACGPVFSHIDDVARYAHEQAGDRSALTFGYIVKAANGQWMATLPVNGEDLRFPKSRVWPRGQLPTGCSVQGLYVCAPARQPDELSASPIYRSFVNPSLLLAALTAVRQTPASGDTFLPLYLSCADSALLKYQASSLIAGWNDPSRLQAYVKKLNGPFNAAEYIREVARAGTLEVLITGEIWATLGQVSQRWTAYESAVYTPRVDERLALGPVFSHADDAARYLWRRITPVPGKAWMAAMLENNTASTVLVTDPVDDSGPAVEVGERMSTSACERLLGGVVNQREPKASPKYPEGYRLMAVQQLYKVDDTRERLADLHEEALASNFIARKEMRFVVQMFSTDNVVGARYYFTPRHGALLVYLPSYLEGESKLLREDWPYRFADTPSQAITSLAHSGKLHILEPDRFWQPRGQVGVRLLMELRKAVRE